MLVFWKKNEKEENIARKKAEKEALDRGTARTGRFDVKEGRAIMLPVQINRQ